MNIAAARLTLVLVTAGLFSVGWTVWRWPREARLISPLAAESKALAQPLAPDSLNAMAAAMTAEAPFRRSRRPAAVAYQPSVVEADMPPEVAPVPRPVLILAGFALGDRPVAVLEGIPGNEGPVVLAEGDTAGGVRVRRIRETGVLVAGYDTVWTLLIKEPWQ